MLEYFRKMLKRGREDDGKEEDPVKVDRELESKYGMSFENSMISSRHLERMSW